MTTLHIENTVRHYDAWKQNFDKFDRARRDRGVRSYRISRGADEPQRVMIDLDFDSVTQAEEFREFLAGVMRTPQAQAAVVDHRPPVLLDVTEARSLA